MSSLKNIYNLRKDYGSNSLLQSNVKKDPFKQFELWFNESVKAGIYESNAFILSTVNRKKAPSSRVVLLKEVTSNGFYFYTNYQSQKGREIDQNQNVSMVFFWPEIHRQIRISGRANKATREESIKYFSMRPLGSQIGAIISPQSQIIKSKSYLQKTFNKALKTYQSSAPECPNHWGGYCIVPNSFEFWQGMSNRLHDRILYIRTGKGSWKIKRLAP